MYFAIFMIYSLWLVNKKRKLARAPHHVPSECSSMQIINAQTGFADTLLKLFPNCFYPENQWSIQISIFQLLFKLSHLLACFTFSNAIGRLNFPGQLFALSSNGGNAIVCQTAPLRFHLAGYCFQFPSMTFQFIFFSKIT